MNDLAPKMVTIHIDGSYHSAMKQLAKKKRVLISLLYEQAVEAFLDTQNRIQNTSKIIVKKTNVPAVIRR